MSNSPYFIGIGLNLVIHQEMCQIRKTTLVCAWRAMKIYKGSFILCFIYLLLGLVIGVLKCQVRLNVEQSGTHCKGSCCKHKKFKTQRFKILLEILCKTFIPSGSHLVIHLMMLIGLSLFSAMYPTIIPSHICTSFLFTLLRGWLIFLGRSYKGHYHICTVGCSKRLQIES